MPLLSSTRSFYAFLFCLSFLFLMANWSMVEAHILATDGPAGAVLHVDPDDEAIVGETATISFDLHDQDTKFTPESCTCTLAISLNGRVVDELALSLSGNAAESTASLPYVFRQPGVYRIELSGAPARETSFKSFRLGYDVRVSQTTQGVSWLLWLHHGIFMVGFLIFGGLLGWNKLRQRRNA